MLLRFTRIVWTSLNVKLLASNSVTRFGEISPLGRIFTVLDDFLRGVFTFWQNFGTTLVNFVCHWENFHSCKRPNVENNIAIWSHWLVIVQRWSKGSFTQAISIRRFRQAIRFQSEIAIWSSQKCSHQNFIFRAS